MLRTVNASAHIQVFVPHRVKPKTRYILAKRTVDQRFRRWCRRNIRRGERKSPRRGAVPKILNRRIVIECHAVSKRFAPQFTFAIAVAHIGVVPAEMVSYSCVRHLRKTAHVTPPRPGQKQRSILRKLKVSILCARLW